MEIKRTEGRPTLDRGTLIFLLNRAAVCLSLLVEFASKETGYCTEDVQVQTSLKIILAYTGLNELQEA